MVSVEVSTPTRLVFRQTPGGRKFDGGIKKTCIGQNFEVTEGRMRSLPDHDRGPRRYIQGSACQPTDS